MEKDPFEYTHPQSAIAYLTSISELHKVMDYEGVVTNENAVAYANVRYRALNKLGMTPMSMNEIHGIKEDSDDTEKE